MNEPTTAPTPESPKHPIATPSPEPTPPQPPSPMHVPDEENELIEKPDVDGPGKAGDAPPSDTRP
jgi:hypothetical protein